MTDSARGRFEDTRLLSGAGRYLADVAPADALVARFLRAPVAKGRVTRLDLAPARGLPGVVAVLGPEELTADGLVEIPWDVEPKRDDGGPVARTPRPLLSAGVVRHLGEPLAMVIAESAAQAEDAVEAIGLEIDAEEPAMGPEGPAVWAEVPDNIAALHRVGDAEAVAGAMAAAAHVTRLPFDITRVTALPMEPRGALGEVSGEELKLTASTQSPFMLRGQLAQVFGMEPEAIRVIAPDVGGSFGMKGSLFREDALVLWAARRLGRPVLWIESRSEGFVTDDQGRGVRGEAALALDAEGRFTGLEVSLDVDAGAYFGRRSMGVLNNLGGIAGQYLTPAIAAEVRFRFSNRVPTTPYRGFGRPEATYVIERLIDAAARETGRSAAALRRANLVPAEAMPFRTGLTFHYDCGDFPKVFDRACALAEVDGFATRRTESEARGMLRGLGFALPIEVAGGPLRKLRKDVASVRLRPDGMVEVAPGCMSVGQGHETALARMVAGRLRVDPGRIVYLQGDTGLLPSGRGSGGSSATVVGGAATLVATLTLIDKARRIAAEALEVSGDDLVLEGGAFQVAGTDRGIPLEEVARRADPEAGLGVLDEFLPGGPTYPNGCHVCEVEVDPETGGVRLVRYTGVEDVGRVLNRELVEGQMQGGIAQGVGQALGEEVVFDAAGQQLSGSFMDYFVPRASDMPEIRLDTVEVPTAVNPLGAKGVGEAGTVGALAATMNAVSDALACRGVARFEMPATPQRVWAALRAAR